MDFLKCLGTLGYTHGTTAVKPRPPPPGIFSSTTCLPSPPAEPELKLKSELLKANAPGHLVKSSYPINITLSYFNSLHSVYHYLMLFLIIFYGFFSLSSHADVNYLRNGFFLTHVFYST